MATITALKKHSGKKAFIPYTAPGDNVTATNTLNKKSFLNGMLLSVSNPSPERVFPPCPAFGQLMHWSYALVQPNFHKLDT